VWGAAFGYRFCCSVHLVGGDDFMGEFTLFVDELPLQIGTPMTQDYPLLKARVKTKKKAGEVSGTIRLTFTKLP